MSDRPAPSHVKFASSRDRRMLHDHLWPHLNYSKPCHEENSCPLVVPITGFPTIIIWFSCIQQSILNLTALLNALNHPIRMTAQSRCGSASIVITAIHQITPVLVLMMTVPPPRSWDCLGREVKNFFLGVKAQMVKGGLTLILTWIHYQYHSPFHSPPWGRKLKVLFTFG